MITVVGLGKEKGDITNRGKKAIKSADKVFCRTFLTPQSRFLLKSGAESFDGLFEKAEDFNELNEKIAAVLKEKAQNKNIVYCVDGDGYSDEAVNILYNGGADIQIIAGVSSAGARKPTGNYSSYCAYDFVSKLPQIDTNFALSVSQIDNAMLAGEVKLYLLLFYAPETKVYYSYNNKETHIELTDLDRQKKYNYSSSVYIKGAESFDKNRYCFADLLKIMKRLTSADGCEWDKAQTHESIRINMIEEAYEAVDAIDAGDIDAMIEETGDVLLQTVFHSDIAERSGEYSLFDVIDSLCRKLVSRHTHIFGGNYASNPAEALVFWEKAKKEEKKHKSLSDELDAIPQVFPASLKAEKAIKKAMKAGLKIDEKDIKEQLSKAVEKNNIEKAMFLCVAELLLNKKDAETELNAVCSQFFAAIKNAKPDELKLTDII